MKITSTVLLVTYLNIFSAQQLTCSAAHFPSTPQAIRDRNDPLPITPAVKPVTRTDGSAGFAIQLKLASGVQIYSERPSEFNIPLRVQFLDSDFRNVPTRIVYPHAKAQRKSVEPLPDYYVYEGQVGTSLVVYGYPIQPAKYVTVAYHGFNKERQH